WSSSSQHRHRHHRRPQSWRGSKPAPLPLISSYLSHELLSVVLLSSRSNFASLSLASSFSLDFASPTRPRVERIPQAVTKQVECERGQEQKEPREEHHPPRHLEEPGLRRIGEHPPPRRSC